MNKIKKVYDTFGKIGDITMSIGMVVVIISGFTIGFRTGLAYATTEMNKEKENEVKE